jgi:hypothetical protein
MRQEFGKAIVKRSHEIKIVRKFKTSWAVWSKLRLAKLGV